MVQMVRDHFGTLWTRSVERVEAEPNPKPKEKIKKPRRVVMATWAVRPGA